MAELEDQLEALLDHNRFEPPAAFARQALDKEFEQPSDWIAHWAAQARELDWITEPAKALDDSRAPFYTWFEDGTLNASYNCVDRHVEAGNGDRVAFHWHGEQGETRTITYA